MATPTRSGAFSLGAYTSRRVCAPRASAGASAPAAPANAPRPPGSGARKNHRVALTTMPSTRPTLGVSFWPDFDYDASGATTLGVVGDPDPSNPGAVHLVFDVTTFEGPPVCGRTTKVFGVPLPPGIRVDVVPLSLEGWLDPVTGACALEFDAEFRGSIFGENFIRLPPMTVRSPLTTGVARGETREAAGVPFGRTPRPDTSRTSDSTSDLDDPSTRERRRRRRDSVPLNPCDGGVPGDVAELVAVARVPRVTGPWDWLMNALLLLPADALAVLPCRLRVWDPDARLGGKEGEGDSGRDANVDEETIVRALDDRFEYAKRKGDPVPMTSKQMDLAMFTFGAASFVEEAHQLYC